MFKPRLLCDGALPLHTNAIEMVRLLLESLLKMDLRSLLERFLGDGSMFSGLVNMEILWDYLRWRMKDSG